MKVAAKVYKGIEFVAIDELPARQKTLLSENKTIERIKILIDGKIVSNCIQYQHYSVWHSTVDPQTASPKTMVKEISVESQVSIK